MATLPEDCGLVIFEDESGRQRVDCTMLDPGASALHHQPLDCHDPHLCQHDGFCTSVHHQGTPLLMRRPIIEELGIVVNFKSRMMMFEDRSWRPITMGLHGEYLLSLTEDFDHELIGQPPFLN